MEVNNGSLLSPKIVLFIFLGTRSHGSTQMPVLASESSSGSNESADLLQDTLGLIALVRASSRAP